MNVQIKHRIVGAIVLVALAAILWPMVFEMPQSQSVNRNSQIPPTPPFEKFQVFEPAPVAPEATVQPVAKNQETVPATEQRQATESVDGSTDRPASGADATQPQLDESGLPVAWAIQVASFAQKENADKLKKQLRAKGFKAYTKRINTPTGKAFRVFVGPKLNKTRAESVKKKLDAEFKLTTLIVRYEA